MTIAISSKGDSAVPVKPQENPIIPPNATAVAAPVEGQPSLVKQIFSSGPKNIVLMMIIGFVVYKYVFKRSA